MADTLTIHARTTCGRLRFGMTRAETVAAIGPADREFTSRYYPYVDDVREDGAFSACTFAEDRLILLRLAVSGLERLFLGDLELLGTPFPTLLAALEQANGGICRSQAGSVYFERLGVALINFEDPGCREFMLFGDPKHHGEPLLEITVDIALSYYIANRESDPALDWMGSAEPRED